MQAFCCDVVRAFTKLGIAIAANNPIMATTIMISTRVKPDFLDALIFILPLLFAFVSRGVNKATGWLFFNAFFSHGISCRNRVSEDSANHIPPQSIQIAHSISSE